jgi:hypothetical protein
MIEKGFIPYKEALELREELGFDEPCLASWNFYTNELNYNAHPSKFSSGDVIPLPTFSQAFRWFREKCDLHAVIMPKTTPSNTTVYYVYKGKFEEDWNNCFETYEEAELACLKRLIKLTNEQ